MADLVIAVELVQAPADEFFISLKDIHELLNEKLSLNAAHLEGLQAAHRRYAIAVKSLEIWRDKRIEWLLDRRFNLSSGKVVELSKAYEAFTTVRAVRMPMGWDREKVERIFAWYGTVKKLDKEEWRAGNEEFSKEYAGLWNGNWRLKMVLRIPIPNTIIVSGEKFEIYYQGQERTCWKCGGSHSKKDCKVAWAHYSNKFDYGQFPPLNSENGDEDEDGEEADMEEAEMEEEQQEQTAEEVVEDQQVTGTDKQVNADVPITVVEEVVEDQQVTGTDKQVIAEVPAPAVNEGTVKQVNANVNGEKKQVNVNEIINDQIEETTDSDKEMADVEKYYKTVLAKTKEALNDQRGSGTATNLKKNVKVKVTVHHKEDSQVISKVGEDNPTNHGESTASASEGEMKNTGMQSKPTKPQDEFLDGLWTMVGGKRKAKQSSDEESDTSIKLGFGTFVNSFLGGSTQRTKKQKEEVSEIQSDGKDKEERNSKTQASS